MTLDRGGESVDKPIPERVQALETWTEEHDRRCEDRQKEIKSMLGEQKTQIQWVGRAMIGLVVALLGWTLAELYRVQTQQHAAPPPAAPQPPFVIYAPPGQPPVVVNPVGGQAATTSPAYPAPPTP